MAVLSSILQDVRITLRLLTRNAGTTALAVLSMALGLGLTTAAFSTGDAVLLRPIAVRDPGGLLRVTSIGEDGRDFLYGWPDATDMMEAARGSGELAVYQRRGAMLGAGDEKERVSVQPVTPNYFSLLGVEAAAGRVSTGGTADRPEAVIGYRLWHRRFGRDPGVVGRTIFLNGSAFVVSGVVAESFTGLDRGAVTDLWMGHQAWFDVFRQMGDRQSRSGQYEIVMRLASGVTPGEAAARLDSAIRGPGKHKPAPAGAASTLLSRDFAPDWSGNLRLGGGLALTLALVMFVVCANIAQLRLALSEGRKKELGLRLALGASRGRLLRQLSTEAAVVVAAGAGFGLLLAQGLMEKAAQFLAAGSTGVDYGIRLDYRVALFVIAAAGLSLGVAGIVPARVALRRDVAGALKAVPAGSDPARSRLKQFLLVLQVAISVGLTGTALLFLASLRNVSNRRPGFDPAKKLFVITAGPGLPLDRTAWCERACDRLAALPGVRGATFARRLPLSESGGGLTVRVEVPGQPVAGVPLNHVGGNYFRVMGTRLLAGRGIEPADRAGAQKVAVVNQTFARQWFGAGGVIGQRATIGGAPREIVGIAEDGPSNDLHEPAAPFVYLPYSQAPADDITLLVETHGDPAALSGALVSELKRFDPLASIYSTKTWRLQLDQALSQDRMLATVTGGLGAFGLLLTLAGLTGVLQYTVSRRAREIGLRMALGAQARQVEKLILSEYLVIAAWGTPIGLALVAGAGWTVRAWLLGVSALDPWIYAASATAVFGCTLLAAWIPARRAARTDPMEALRAD